jgi:hypothetical protein
VEVTTYESAEENVGEANESLCAENTLPEVPWVAHLSHEGNEKQSTAVCVHHAVDSVELRSETGNGLLVLVWWWASEGVDRIRSLDESRGKYGFVVDSIVGRGVHDDDEVDNVHPHGQMADPAEMLQLAHEAGSDTDKHDDKNDDNVANLLLGNLVEKCGVSENDDGDTEELLQRLGDVDEVTTPWAEDSQEGVTETQHGETRRVEAEEDFPDTEGSECSGDTEDDEEGNTRAETDSSKDRSENRFLLVG